MKVARTRSELRSQLLDTRGAGTEVGFVPTMGALHAGHLSLVSAARDQCERVVMSIFVNPLQFGPGEDFGAYPRREQEDVESAEAEGVDVVFLPPVEEVHPPGRTTSIDVGELAAVLEGEFRPGHFAGVATVVMTLFDLVQPDKAFFGQKDAQQLAVIRRMVRDLAVPVEIVGCPTVREEDGLALSSRNAYLSGTERERAVVLFRALTAGKDRLLERAEVEEAEGAMWTVLSSVDGVHPEYARVVDPDTFQAPSGERVLLVVAARVGPARLIDNLLVEWMSYFVPPMTRLEV
jgi:pantoate--beta-alanine ligase